MKPIIIELDHSLSVPLYIQLYDRIKQSITAGSLAAGEKLPSLRALAREDEGYLTHFAAPFNSSSASANIS